MHESNSQMSTLMLITLTNQTQLKTLHSDAWNRGWNEFNQGLLLEFCRSRWKIIIVESQLNCRLQSLYSGLHFDLHGRNNTQASSIRNLIAFGKKKYWCKVKQYPWYLLQLAQIKKSRNKIPSLLIWMKHYLCHQIKHCKLNCKKSFTKNNNHFNTLEKLQNVSKLPVNIANIHVSFSQRRLWSAHTEVMKTIIEKS